MANNYSIEINPTNTYEIQLNEQGPQGNRGEAGNGIVSYEKTSTDVLVDTYTITFTNGNKQTVKVNNGKGITSITGPVTDILKDTYTIHYNDNTTSEYYVYNGKGIVNIIGPSSIGLTDTYTINYNDGTTSTFEIENGNGITDISKTSTSGLVDTYTISFSNGNDTTFTVTNGEKGDTGNGILSIENDTISSDVDTTVYDINYTDGTNDTISITNSIVGGATAIINNNVGTPDVNVTTTSDEYHPNRKLFNFQFLNLKGNTGDTGPQGISVTGVTLISTVGLDKTYRMTFSNGTYFDYVVQDGAAGATTWGGITGVLSNQIDLSNALNNLQSQIDTIVQSSDVFDIVGTYTDLQNYDISTVPVNDIIKVLIDSTHSGAATYYRCIEVGSIKSWSYIGTEGAYYTKSEADALLANKQNVINSNNKLSVNYISGLSAVATSNNYSDLSNLPTFKTINNNSIIGSGNISIDSEPEIYWATLNETTATEVSNALSEGKIIFVKDTLGNICQFVNEDNSAYYFASYHRDTYRNYMCQYFLYKSNNQWYGANTTFETVSNKVTSISSSSTNTQYPSAKCVYDNITTKQDIAQLINTLSTSGTITLSDNSIYYIAPTGTVTFTLPTVSDNTKFHQILVQINMASAVTIDVGTTYFFNKTAPDLSATGLYNLIYEYDGSNWVVGCVSKGAAS